MSCFAKRVVQQYMLLLQKQPLRTKAITAVVLSAMSDIVSQKLSGIQKLQLKRLLLRVLFTVVYHVPVGHFSHKFLDKLFKGNKDTKTVAKKVVLEQITILPWNNLMFMIYHGLVIEGRPWAQVKSKIKKEYLAVQSTAWSLGTVVGWINHQYLPLELRVVFQNLLAFGWGIYLNLKARSALTKG